MNYREVMSYLEGSWRFGSRLGLERIRGLLARLGDPHVGIPSIHVAGTNGKGSTTSMIATMLAQSGRRVGIFTSPYIERFSDRIRVLDGPQDVRRRLDDSSTGEISEDAIARIFTRVSEADRQMQADGMEAATEFELITAMAFCYFAERACDCLVLEVGLGGALDSTNVIPAPVVAVITALGYDHCDRLGSTMREIAGQKAGIIKAGTKRVILYDPNVAAQSANDALTIVDVIGGRCAELGVPLERVLAANVTLLSTSFDGQRFQLQGFHETLETRLVGQPQLLNAAVAVRAVKAFDPSLHGQTSLREGLRLTRWPGRFERVRREPTVVLDGAHNPQAVEALVANCQLLLPERPLVVILGLLADKDGQAMAQRFFLEPSLDIREVICTAPDNPRRMEPEALEAIVGQLLVARAERLKRSRTRPGEALAAGGFREPGDEAGAVEEPTPVALSHELASADALARALESAEALGPDAAVIAWGSLYLVSELRARHVAAQGAGEEAAR